jgi:AraC-like DNA-binding protein
MMLQDLLWVDLRSLPSTFNLYQALGRRYSLHLLLNPETIADAINEFSPIALCFEYDYPDLRGLRALQKTKSGFPHLPILMLTEYHPEVLAIWALRNRVWDYFVKPVILEELTLRLDSLLRLPKKKTAERRINYMPTAPIPREVKFSMPRHKGRIAAQAASFVEKRYSYKIRLQDVAQFCGLKPIQFSLVFKKQQGITFREFLLRYRIQKAQDLLAYPGASITDIALSAGFNDLSFFSKMFLRYVGSRPSDYRARLSR